MDRPYRRRHDRQAVQRFHDRRREVRTGRHPLRRQRQCLVLEQCRPRGRLQRRYGLESSPFAWQLQKKLLVTNPMRLYWPEEDVDVG